MDKIFEYVRNQNLAEIDIGNLLGKNFSEFYEKIRKLKK